MTKTPSTAGAVLARSAMRHSLAWLVAANLVGVWLAVLLLFPTANDWVAPFTYGHWVPLHLDWELYGWTALPIIGVMLRWFASEADARADRHARRSLWVWSIALLLGGGTWLGGWVSGKLFLDWTGPARPLLPLAMLFLWAVLARAVAAGWAGWDSVARAVRLGVLGVLLPVPPLLYWSLGRRVYPAVNPDSGGATGAALLGSTLVIVTVFLVLPYLLRLRNRWSTRRHALVWAALVASWAVYAVIDHGHTSHHQTAQIVALAALLAWIPLLAIGWAGHEWPEGARPWRWATLGWWTLLVLDGWLTFLPGLSEAMKFTHGLVGHAHLAMAGVVTSVNGAMLTSIAQRPAPRGVFLLWQSGCVLHVGAMLALGVAEAGHTGELFRSEAWTQAWFGVRLLGGILMLDASRRWLKDAWQ